MGNVADGQVERHWASAEGGEGYRFAPRAESLIAAPGSDAGIVLRFWLKVTEFKILMRVGNDCTILREVLARRVLHIPSGLRRVNQIPAQLGGLGRQLAAARLTRV